MNIEYKLSVLKKIAYLFNEASITYAVGASCLLYFKGITNHFNDLDIVVLEEDIFKAKEILVTLGTLNPPKSNEGYKTRHFLEFVVEEVDVDIMAGFVIVNRGKDYDCSLKKEQIKEYSYIDEVCIPLHDVKLWREYYNLMGRENKVAIIDNHLSK